MTERKAALIALRDAVRGGEILQAVDAVEAFPMTPTGDVAWLHACKASQGSLDAARALHDAVLPGWAVANIGQACWDGSGGWRVWITSKEYLTDMTSASAAADTPARAWLLAILEALIAQEAPE